MDNLWAKGQAELRAVRRESRPLFWAVGLFSFFVNLLLMTGPLYMLNIYDRVLQSRSVETLVALTLLAGFLFTTMGILDHVRHRIMTRVGARFQDRLDRRVFTAALQASAQGRSLPAAATGPRDLEAVQRMVTSPAMMAMFDLPWVPLFFLAIFVFHPLLGILGLCGALVLILCAVLAQTTTRSALQQASAQGFAADQIGQQMRQNSDCIHALGMRSAVFDRWQSVRHAALSATIGAADHAGGFTATIKAFRMFLQSALLGLGAYLVLQAQLSPGAMIAASILLGRALSPVEIIVGQWPVLQRGHEGWQQLAQLLTAVQPALPRLRLPRPQARLTADQVTLIPPGAQHATLRMISFDIPQGQAVGVIGTSGAGKTSLARVLTGIWPAAGGSIRLDGAALDQYDPDTLGSYIGYLPQQVQLFDGTIRDNIARLAVDPDDAQVVQAAKMAGVHDLIVKLPCGYDTLVTQNLAQLSGGQIQRIGLARALYADPVVLVLDEPNANLDHDGSLALGAAIRAFKAKGGVVFIMAHRPAAIQDCDLLLVLENGIRRAFGPRDKVLADIVKNVGQIRSVAQPVGLA